MLRGEPGRSFVLRRRTSGSLDVGSPVYYRRMRVGRVVGYTLDAARDSLAVQVFIEAPNEHLVTTDSRFWNASGIDRVAQLPAGLTLNTQSRRVDAGRRRGVRQPGRRRPAPPAADGQRFELFATRKAALAPPDGAPLRVRMVFEQSLRGLVAGAPVDLLGVEIGTVRSVALLHVAEDRAASRSR